MANSFNIFVGTVGSGLWRSTDGGETWGRARVIDNESQVRAIAVHPIDPKILYSGNNEGIYRSEDSGETWEHLDSPMNDLHVWAITIDPVDPDIIFAGTKPPALFRSRDGGQRWEKLSVDLAEVCNIGIPRVTALVVDPQDHQVVWAGVEVDGVRRSLDGGDSWVRIAGGLNDPDIHGIALSLGQQKRALVSTPREIFASADVGESWEGLGVLAQFPMPYCRAVAVRPDDPQVIFVGNGDAAVGATGTVQRSRDGGHNWETLPLPAEPNTPIWCIATHPEDPDRVLACSHYGELFHSSDGGDSWGKFKREFTEIRALAWTPN